MSITLVEQVSLLLIRKGFMVKSANGCFNLVARKGSRIFLLKVLTDANSLTLETAKEMQKIAASLQAIPLLVAERGGFPMEDSIVYLRHGIPALTPLAFEAVLAQQPLYLQSGKAGITVSLNAAYFREQREAEGHSLTDISKQLNVSRRMVAEYESERCDISLQRALKLYDLFGPEIFEPFEFEVPKCYSEPCTSEIGQKYGALGFDAVETKKTLFDLLARKEQELIITCVGDFFDTELQALSRLLVADHLLIFEKSKPKAETPMIAKDEFLELETSKELLKLVKEFG